MMWLAFLSLPPVSRAIHLLSLPQVWAETWIYYVHLLSERTVCVNTSWRQWDGCCPDEIIVWNLFLSLYNINTSKLRLPLYALFISSTLGTYYMHLNVYMRTSFSDLSTHYANDHYQQRYVLSSGMTCSTK